MALVLEGMVATMDAAAGVLPHGAVYVADGRIQAVQPAGDPAPAGFETAARIRADAIYPGLIDLHSHLAYNCRPLWIPPGHDAPFTRRDQWPRLAAYASDIRLPTLALTQVASKAVLKYVEVKAVVGGVTAIQGSAVLTHPYEGWLVRNVEFETFGTGKRSVYQSVRTLGATDFATARRHLTAGSAFIYHLAEGSAPELIGEYDALRDHDCLQPKLIGVHATALGPPQYQDWGPHGSSMVWSPFSNLWLYRRTSDVAAARAHGIRVCLGADWAPSGSKHLLGELKVAALYNDDPGGLDGTFSPRELCELVTANPADALGWDDRIGRIRPGLLADLLVTRQVDPDPYRNLIATRERDVQLVLVGGRPVYGTGPLMEAAGVDGAEPIDVGGLARMIRLRDPAVPDADLSWAEVLAQLEAARHDPAGTQRRLLATSGDAEPFRLIPDDPGGLQVEPLTQADLAKVQIPELDTLVHDAAFFSALESAPILGGLLNDLRRRYYTDGP